MPKTSRRDDEEEVGCSSRASPRDFIGPLPLPALNEAAAQEADEGQGQAPVFQINKIIDNLSEDCEEKDSTMEE